MFLWHHYFLTGLIHLVLVVLYDIIYTENIFDDQNGAPFALIIWLFWPIFDALMIGYTIRDWRNKK